MPGATHHPPPTTQLLSKKEEADNKVPLVRMSQSHIAQNYQVDSDNNNMGESKMIKEKVIKNQ